MVRLFTLWTGGGGGLFAQALTCEYSVWTYFVQYVIPNLGTLLDWHPRQTQSLRRLSLSSKSTTNIGRRRRKHTAERLDRFGLVWRDAMRFGESGNLSTSLARVPSLSLSFLLPSLCLFPGPLSLSYLSLSIPDLALTPREGI